MNDPDSAIVQILAAMNRLTAILTLHQNRQMDPETVAAIRQLTQVLGVVALKTEALTERQFRELLIRPSPPDDKRNTSLWGSSQGTDDDE